MKKITQAILGGIVFLLVCFDIVSVKADKDNVAYNENQFIKLVYEAMLKREDTVVIEYKGKNYLDIFNSFENEEFLKKVSAIDDPETTDDFDYMGHNLSYMKTAIKYSRSTSATFTISIEWRETYEQTQYVNENVQIILKELDIQDKTTYEKVKKIHDYIVENVEYDSALQKENAYYALKDGMATCQGYSLLFYKMLTQAGVKSRYITGVGTSENDSGAHGWNIVKVGKLWYNVDTTWDDPVYINAEKDVKKEISYDFFLKGANSFDGSHERDDEYLTKEFKEAYPISDKDFDIKTYVDEFDEEVEKPLVWELGSQTDTVDENGRSKWLNIDTYTQGVIAVLDWCSDVSDGKIDAGKDLKERWSKQSLKNKLILISIIIFIVFLKIMKIQKARERKKMEMYRYYNKD